MALPAEIYSALSLCSALAMSHAIASFTPLRYPIPNPTTQPAAMQPKTATQIRATSNAQTIEASADHLLGTHGPHHQSPRQSRRRA
jgi:hypothetical protein